MVPPPPTPPLNLSRRDDSSPNSSAGPMVGAIFGIAIAIYILSIICIKVIKGMKAYQRENQPIYVVPIRPGIRNPGGPPVVNLPAPAPVALPPPTVVSNDSDTSGGVPLPPGIYPRVAWPNRANRSIPVDMRRSHGRDPRRTRSEYRR